MREEILLRPDRKCAQKGSERYEYLNDLSNGGHALHWIDYSNWISRFARCISIEVNSGNVEVLAKVARERWKIENRGFDEQKNYGYYLQHLYSRISNQARSNYYILLQIAHLINQLGMLEVNFKVATRNFTRKKIFEYLRALLQTALSKIEKLRQLLSRKQHHYQLE